MPNLMQLSIELLETDAQISRKILQEIADQFNKDVSGKLPSITQKIKLVTIEHLKSTFIYESLISGDLAGHFGLPVLTRRNMVDNIVKTIAGNIEIEYNMIRVRGIDFTGGITIQVLLSNFSDILSMTEAFVTTERGQSLPWLEWLLIHGNKIIVSQHEIHLIGGKGRSGRGIMVKNDASIWRVPPAFSGTIRNNWLTRAFLEQPDIYLNKIKDILEKELI